MNSAALQTRWRRRTGENNFMAQELVVHNEWDDLPITCRAVAEGWPLTQDQLQLCVDKLHAALEDSHNPRDVARIVTAFSRLYGQNQTERLAQKYMLPIGQEGMTRVLAPSEIASEMDSSVPAIEDRNSREEPEQEAWPDPPILSAPVLSSLNAD
jgi:glucan phosphorylase